MNTHAQLIRRQTRGTQKQPEDPGKGAHASGKVSKEERAHDTPMAHMTRGKRGEQ